MRLIYVGRLPPRFGGSALTSWQILCELARSGCQIDAIAPIGANAANPGWDPGHPAIVQHRFEARRYYTDSIGVRTEEDWESETRAITSLIERLAARNPPDLILAGHEGESLPVPDIAERLGVPWVLRCGGYSLHLAVQGQWPEAVAAKLRDTVSRANAIILQASHLIPAAEQAGARKIHVIPNPVDLRRFSPRPRPAALAERLGIPSGSPVILHASVMSRVKRITDVAESSTAVLERFPNAIYVAAGEGPGRGSVDEWARSHGIAGNYRFTGWLEYPEMPDMYALADVVVMSSEFEQQPRVAIEAMASGRVIVASDIAGARELVTHGVNGLLFRPGDPASLASQIIQALESPALRERLGRAAHERMQQQSLERIGASFLSVLQDLAEPRRVRVHD